MPPRSIKWFIIIVIAVLFAAVAAVTMTDAWFTDEESPHVNVAASDDVTASVDSMSVTPEKLYLECASNETESCPSNKPLTVLIDIREPSVVDETSFTVRIPETAGLVAVSQATCTQSSGHWWTCKLLIDQEDMLSDLDSSGEYEIIVRGWWQYNRAFEGKTTITVTSAPESITSQPTAPPERTTMPPNSTTPTTMTPSNTTTTTTTSTTAPQTTTSTPSTETTDPATVTMTPQSTKSKITTSTTNSKQV